MLHTRWPTCNYPSFKALTAAAQRAPEAALPVRRWHLRPRDLHLINEGGHAARHAARLHVPGGGRRVAEEEPLLEDGEGEHGAPRAEEGVGLGADERVDDGEVRLREGEMAQMAEMGHQGHQGEKGETGEEAERGG